MPSCLTLAACPAYQEMQMSTHLYVPGRFLVREQNCRAWCQRDCCWGRTLRFSAKIPKRVLCDSGSSVLPCPWRLGLIYINKVCGLHTRWNRSGQPAICNELLRERAERPNLRPETQICLKNHPQEGQISKEHIQAQHGSLLVGTDHFRSIKSTSRLQFARLTDDSEL